MALRATEPHLVTTYLHMTDPAQFQPSFVEPVSGQSLMIMQMHQTDVSFYRFLYNTVGEQWRWRDRRLMSDEELLAALSCEGCSVHVLYVNGTPAGYVELSKNGDEVEIAYFGLRPSYMGNGLGKHLLSYGIARAWDSGAKRVIVHTCNLDAPQALSNYMKRGFHIYHTEQEPLPDRYLQ
jgi:GNAT superfamily N-acetyltransferase